MIYNYDYYRIFYYVAAHRSMTAAVAQLGISASTASRAVKALEDELGKPLFIRKKHGVDLTAEGETLYTQILPAMQRLIACEEQFRDGSLTPDAAIDIAVEPGLFEDILMPLCLPRFYKKYPHTRVRNLDLNGDEIENKLLTGELDFACAWIFRLLTNRCEVTPLIQIRNVPIVGEKYASLTKKEVVSLRQLSELPLILVPETYKVYVQYSRLFSANGLTMQPALTVSSVHQQIAAVKAGLGYSFVPFFSAADVPGVYPLRLKEDLSNAFMDFLITPKDRPMSAPADYLCELFRAELANAAARQEAFWAPISHPANP